MAEQQGQQYGQGQYGYGEHGMKSLLPDKGPSASKVVAVATLFPIGGILLTLAGLTLTGTIIGLALATPLFIIFSPVLVPAAIAICLAVTGFLTSGAFGLTALSSLSWIINYMRRFSSNMPEHMEHAKRRMQEAAGTAGQKTREVSQGVQQKAHEAGRKE
ncbi:hypothetical protein GIB67_004390 [Kingdonia uniflora]|uniref:Oleosin n=1 Tax=Kingdonia uniflora TaxID=39325 RepID=A0A7J7MRN5_9MAGN|nr:hypothetical protein GIB67_004390 [Kingdonia uniflora]